MGKPLLELAPLRGVQDLQTFLEVVSDPRKYKAIVKEMEDLRADLNTRIAAIGKIQDIEKQRAEADRDRKQASAQLTEARVLIAKEQAVWDQQSRGEKDGLAKRSRSIAERDRNGKADLDAREKAVAAREQAAEKAMADAKVLREKVEASQVQAEGMRKSLDAKLAVIDDTLGKVRH